MSHPIEETNTMDKVEVNVSQTSKFEITATFDTCIDFMIDVPLGDKNIVDGWWIKYGILYVNFTNGVQKQYTGEIRETDYKYTRHVYVQDLDEDLYEYIEEGEIIEV